MKLRNYFDSSNRRDFDNFFKFVPSHLLENQHLIDTKSQAFGTEYMTQNYITIDPQGTRLAEMHGYLLGAVGPRPIALASTVDREGNPNLAPFSYFNVFSTRPPILIIAPNRSGKTGMNKDTARNAFDTFEVVVNVISYSIVQQINLASASFAQGINEFEKSGLTGISSLAVKPLRVKESPVQLECKVREFISLGAAGGAGNLIICDVVLMHISESILDENGKISPQKLDLVGRMGGDWFVRTGNEQGKDSPLFVLPKPPNDIIGYDALPKSLLNSEILTANDLGKLAHATRIMDDQEVQTYLEGLTTEQKTNLKEKATSSPEESICTALSSGNLTEAWVIIRLANIN